MENMLKAQRSLEKIEVLITQHMSAGTVENTHARFLSALDSSHPEASYLLTIGHAVIHPLTSRMNTFRVGTSSNASRTKSARGGSPHVRPSRAMAARG